MLCQWDYGNARWKARNDVEWVECSSGFNDPLGGHTVIVCGVCVCVGVRVLQGKWLTSGCYYQQKLSWEKCVGSFPALPKLRSPFNTSGTRLRSLSFIFIFLLCAPLPLSECRGARNIPNTHPSVIVQTL